MVDVAMATGYWVLSKRLDDRRTRWLHGSAAFLVLRTSHSLPRELDGQMRAFIHVMIVCSTSSRSGSW
jgi:hypothetical protein